MQRAWNLDEVEPPWRGGVSILAHIRTHLTEDGRLDAAGAKLPDERDDGGLRWVAGGFDGAFGHNGGGGGEAERAEAIVRALQDVLEDATEARLAAFYERILDGSAIGYIDPFLETLGTVEGLDVGRLWALARWLVERSPDREAVKLGIAILGGFSDPEQRELMMTLGTHEEFTLYAAVALRRREGAAAERDLFTLAQRVDGWGRIQLVERLARTSDPEIKAWMLRKGYANAVMNEYLAYTCATAGGLRDAIAESRIDEELLVGAGEIIEALISGGPAEDMDDYADGATVVEHYLRHLGAEPQELRQLVVVDRIRGFLDEEVDEDEEADEGAGAEDRWKAREARGWTPALREQLRARCRAIIELPHWPGLVSTSLHDEEPAALWVAYRVARILGIDTWDHSFERLTSGRGSDWYRVMQTDDPTRIDRVVALAEERLDLDAIASGPANELGFGPEWAQHSHLGFVVQDLTRFPGKGWRLIQVALRSPVTRNRNMALRVLSAWGRAAWPEDARAVLERAMQDEPEEAVGRAIARMLAGGRFEEDDGERGGGEEEREEG